MTHNCPKLEKYLFLGSSGCIFWGGRGGPGESSCHEGSEYVWQRGVGSQKGLVMGRQHCRLSICIKLDELTNSVSIRQQDPNDSSDTETRCLVYSCLID